MTNAGEMLIERRRMRHRLSLWRVAAIVLGLLLLLAVVLQDGGEGLSATGRDHVARVNIKGMILDDSKQQKLLKDLKESDKVKAVVLRINSPGGTTAGGEALYGRIRELSQEKPVVAVFGTVAASAAYMAGIAADRIVTRGSTITGSVGVIVQWPDVSEMMTKLGVSMEELKSGKLKAEPSPFRRADAERLAPMKEMVEDTFTWFIALVEERRKIKPDEIPGLREGRIYSGRQAVKYGLADEIGGEDEAIAWLEDKKEIDKDLPVVDRKPESDLPFNPLQSLLTNILGWTGLDRWWGRLFSPVGLLSLEQGASPGLMSVWRLSTSDGH